MRPYQILLILTAGLLGRLYSPAAAAENYGFARPINPQWFLDDARQWPGYSRSILLTDLSQAQPASALVTEARKKGKWKVIPYETKAFHGQALGSFNETNPEPVHLALGATGWYAVYVGIGTLPRSRRVMKSTAEVKLHSAPVYRRIANNLMLVEPRRDVIQEQFITLANLAPGESLDFAPLPHAGADLMYVRLVPVAETERLAWERDGAQLRSRTESAEFDGHSWIWNYAPRTKADVLANFEGYQRTDFGQWWFCVLGVDLTFYPSQVGTIPGAGTEDFPDEAYAEFTRSAQALAAKGINPLQVARDEARRQGRQFHVFIRPEAWGAPVPFEGTFTSQLFHDHPEWREIDREGHQAMYMSYAVPQVREKSLAILRESVQMADPDGVGFFFNRGVPLMLREPAFAAQFQAEYRIELRTVAEDDPRIYRLRGKIMTEYFRSVRAMLDREGQARGGKHYAITAVTFANQALNTQFGLDVETWVREGLVDQLAPSPCHYFEDVPYDLAYYHRVVAGTKVPVYPYVIAWKTEAGNSGNPAELCRQLVAYYDAGATGIAVWDQGVEEGYRTARYDGNVFDVLAYAGHRELLAYWASHGVPVPASFPLQKFGENEYSKWWPNAGY